MHLVIICYDAIRRSVQIVELPAFYAPHEGNADQECEYHGKRNQQEENVHRHTFMSRIALATTTSEDTDMPIDAASGDTNPNAASGMAKTL